MTLWLLKPRDDLTDDANPWASYDGWNLTHRMIVRATTEDHARAMAQAECLNEEPYVGEAVPCRTQWSDAKYSTCEVVTGDGTAEVLISYYREG